MIKKKYYEPLFMILLTIVLFTYTFFNKRSPSFEFHKLAFFSNYIFGAIIISYYLLPSFFYKKKYLHFLIGLLSILLFIYFIEEFVMEKIFFNNNRRGQIISNVFYTLLDIIPTIFVFVGFKFAWDANKKQAQVEQLQYSIQESELRFLKSQINPHFLFNNLNNLYSYAIENSPKTPSIILELSSVLRYMLYDCKDKFVLLSKEIEHLKHFTALNELQIEERGKVTFRASNLPNNFVIAPLILMMFIENAFKHSTASQSDNLSIDVHVDVTDEGLLHFKCSNSFLQNANNQSLSKGIGLINVKKRLEILYPDNKHSLQINNTGHFYQINLTLQLQSK